MDARAAAIFATFVGFARDAVLYAGRGARVRNRNAAQAGDLPPRAAAWLEDSAHRQVGKVRRGRDEAFHLGIEHGVPEPCQGSLRAHVEGLLHAEGLGAHVQRQQERPRHEVIPHLEHTQPSRGLVVD